MIFSIVSCNRNYTFPPVLDLGNSEVFSHDAVVQEQYSIQGEIREPLRSAIVEWNKIAGRGLFTEDIGPFSVYIKWVDKLSGKLGDDKEVYGVTYRYANKCEIELLNKDKSFAYEMFLISAHELGHCIGFMHTKTKSSLMYPDLSPQVRFTKQIQDIVRATNVSVYRDRNAPK